MPRQQHQHQHLAAPHRASLGDVRARSTMARERGSISSFGGRSCRHSWVFVACALACLVLLGSIGGVSGAAIKRAATPRAEVDGPHQHSDLGNIISDLQNAIKRAKDTLNAGKNAFNQVGSAFNSLGSEIDSFPDKLNGVKNEVGKLVGTISDKVEGFVDEVYGKLFPTDAGAMVSDIAGKFMPAASWENNAKDRILRIYPRSAVSFVS